MKKYMTVTVKDGSKWAVPVEIIARNRATYYANEFEGDIEKSLAEDTIPLFEMDEYEIQDWAVGNMNWSDFDGHQVKVENAPPPDFFDAWLSGEKGFIDLIKPKDIKSEIITDINAVLNKHDLILWASPEYDGHENYCGESIIIRSINIDENGVYPVYLDFNDLIKEIAG